MPCSFVNNVYDNCNKKPLLKMKMLGNHFSKESELFSVIYIYQKLNDKFSNLCPYGFNGSCKYVTELLLHSINQRACKLLELTPNTQPMDYALNCLSATDHMLYFFFPFISFYFLFFCISKRKCAVIPCPFTHINVP